MPVYVIKYRGDDPRGLRGQGGEEVDAASIAIDPDVAVSLKDAAGDLLAYIPMANLLSIVRKD